MPTSDWSIRFPTDIPHSYWFRNHFGVIPSTKICDLRQYLFFRKDTGAPVYSAVSGFNGDARAAVAEYKTTEKRLVLNILWFIAAECLYELYVYIYIYIYIYVKMI